MLISLYLGSDRELKVEARRVALVVTLARARGSVLRLQQTFVGHGRGIGAAAFFIDDRPVGRAGCIGLASA